MDGVAVDWRNYQAGKCNSDPRTPKSKSVSSTTLFFGGRTHVMRDSPCSLGSLSLHQARLPLPCLLLLLALS